MLNRNRLVPNLAGCIIDSFFRWILEISGAQWLLGFKNNTGICREIVEMGQESKPENIALADLFLL